MGISVRTGSEKSSSIRERKRCSRRNVGGEVDAGQPNCAQSGLVLLKNNFSKPARTMNRGGKAWGVSGY